MAWQKWRLTHYVAAGQDVPGQAAANDADHAVAHRWSKQEEAPPAPFDRDIDELFAMPEEKVRADTIARTPIHTASLPLIGICVLWPHLSLLYAAATI
jgi:hypothetical protein